MVVRNEKLNVVKRDACKIYNSLSDDGELVLLRERLCPIKKLEPISSEVALQHP